MVPVIVAGQQLRARAAGPEHHELHERGRGIGRLRQPLVKPPAMFGQNLVRLPLLGLDQRFEAGDAGASHDIEAQAEPHELEVLDQLPASVESLGDDPREGLPMKAWTVEQEAEPIEERFHEGGDLERVVRRSEDDPVGRHYLLDERVAVILKRAEILPPSETHLAAATDAEVVIAQNDDLVLDAAERSQVVQELARGGAGHALLARASDEYGDFFHAPTPMTSIPIV